MFYLDFGSLVTTSSSEGATSECGELSLNVGNVAWWAYRHRSLVAAAGTINQAAFAAMVDSLIGATIAGPMLTPSEDRLEFALGSDSVLAVDLKNLWKTDSEVVEIDLPNGTSICMGKRKYVVEADVPEWPELQLAAKSHHRH
jgi:NAD(P)H-hydrate repair Nnr-like enzyme with NAD(P)H-hydrate epimerase domain